MENISFEGIISSKPFRFSIGPQKREFTVHSALVAGCSPALDRLVNGEFKEAQDLYAELEFVNEETFVLFTQYAYTGDYNIEISEGTKLVADPEPDAAIEPPEPPADIEPPEYDVWDWPTKKTKCSRCERSFEAVTTRQDKSWRDKSWSEFKNKCSNAFPTRKDWPAIKFCTSNILLLHARLYVFADYFGISRLMDLSYYRLGKALADIEVDGNTVEDIVNALQYCYDQLAPQKLRSLLVLYAACKVDTLWKSTKFRELSTRHGELSGALIGAMVDQLD